MAGAVLEMTLEELAQFLQRKAESLQRLNLEKPLRIVLQLVKSETKENFAQGHAPDGTPWLPLKRPRQGRRHQNSSPLPLRDTGLLMASVTAAGPHHVERVTATSLEMGTNLEYAAIHQFGGTIHQPARERGKPWVFASGTGETIFTRTIKAHDVTIPARPFLGWNEKLLEQTAEVLGEALANEIGS